jgi:hypothetical protein
MAKYIGLLSSDARGKVGGIVLSRSRAGTTIKAKTIPKAPTSIGQRGAQSVLSAAIGVWRTLEAAQQTTWSVFAATLSWSNSLGGVYSPTGQQLWTQAFINAARFGTQPPGTFISGYTPPTPITSVDLTTSGDDMLLTAYTASGAYDGFLLAFGSLSVPIGVNYTATRARNYLGQCTSGNEINLFDLYVQRWGTPPPAGNFLPIRLVPTSPDVWLSGTIFVGLPEIEA